MTSLMVFVHNVIELVMSTGRCGADSDFGSDEFFLLRDSQGEFYEKSWGEEPLTTGQDLLGSQLCSLSQVFLGREMWKN